MVTADAIIYSMNDMRKIRVRNVLLLLVLLLGLPAGSFFAFAPSAPNIAPAIAVAVFEFLMASMIVKAALQELRQKLTAQRNS